MKLTFQDYICDIFRYEGSAPGTCPIAPSSSDAILTVHMRYTLELKPKIITSDHFGMDKKTNTK